MTAWEERCRDGFTIVDGKRKIAVKILPSDAEQLMKQLQNMLAGAYLAEKKIQKEDE